MHYFLHMLTLVCSTFATKLQLLQPVPGNKPQGNGPWCWIYDLALFEGNEDHS